MTTECPPCSVNIKTSNLLFERGQCISENLCLYMHVHGTFESVLSTSLKRLFNNLKISCQTSSN